MDEAQVVEALAGHQTYTWAPGREDKEEGGTLPPVKLGKEAKRSQPHRGSTTVQVIDVLFLPFPKGNTLQSRGLVDLIS